MDYDEWFKLNTKKSGMSGYDVEPTPHQAWEFKQDEINDLTEQNKILMAVVELISDKDNANVDQSWLINEARIAKRKIEAMKKGE